MNVLAMLFTLQKNAYPNLSVEYVYLIRGHSFLPAARVLGRIEQNIRKLDTILMPEEYYSILRGNDWQRLAGIRFQVCYTEKINI